MPLEGVKVYTQLLYFSNLLSSVIGSESKTEEYRGKEEFDEIRSRLPDWVIELDRKSGVLGEEGYVYTIGEKEE